MSGQDDHAAQPGAIQVQHHGEVLASANLVVVSGQLAGRVFQLVNTETVIGRGSSAQVQLLDRSISTNHAKVMLTSDGHSLMDLALTNGTFLNGRQIKSNQPFDLSPGDSIQIAETILAYLPANAGESPEQTHYLSKLIPNIASSSALRLPDPRAPDMQLLAQLLQMSPQPEVQPKGLTLEERIAQLKRLGDLVRRNWLPLFSAMALCGFIGNASGFLMPPSSEAKFRIRITPPKDDTDLQFDRDRSGFYSAAEQAFMNPKLAEGTLRDLGVEKINKARIDTELKALDLDSVAKQTYEGKYVNKDASYAVKFLQRYLENYLGQEIGKTLRVREAEATFLTDRLKERDAALAKTEEDLKAFKEQHMEGLPEYSTGHIASRETLYARRTELGSVLSKANLELSLARKRLHEEAPLLTKRLESAGPFEQALIGVKAKLSEARSRGLGNEHPEVVALAKQQQDLERLAKQARDSSASELERGANPGLIELRNRVGDLEVESKAAGAELGEINSQLTRLDGIVGKMPEIEARYAQLMRDYGTNKEAHAKLFEQLRAAQLKLDLERTSARARYEVITPPESSGVALRKVLIARTAIGIGIGLLLGAIIAAVLELRRYLAGRRASRTSLVLAQRPSTNALSR